jgi:hypothetical protein
MSTARARGWITAGQNNSQINHNDGEACTDAYSEDVVAI